MSASESKSESNLRWWPHLLFLGALWGSSFLFTQIVSKDMGPFPMAFMRVAVASLFLLPILLIKGLWQQWMANIKWVSIGGLFGAGIPFACYAWGLLSISTTLASITNATTPIFAALMVWLVIGNRPTWPQIVGLMVGMVGVGILVLEKAAVAGKGVGPTPLAGVLICLMAPVSYGISASLTKKHLQNVAALTSATGGSVASAVMLLPMALWFWPDHAPSALSWASVLALGVFCTGVAYLVYYHLIMKAGTHVAATSTFWIPVFAALYGFVLLDERLTPTMWLGAAIILAGVLLASLNRLPTAWLLARSQTK